MAPKHAPPRPPMVPDPTLATRHSGYAPQRPPLGFEASGDRAPLQHALQSPPRCGGELRRPTRVGPAPQCTPPAVAKVLLPPTDGGATDAESPSDFRRPKCGALEQSHRFHSPRFQLVRRQAYRSPHIHPRLPLHSTRSCYANSVNVFKWGQTPISPDGGRNRVRLHFAPRLRQFLSASAPLRFNQRFSCSAVSADPITAFRRSSG